MSRKFLRQKLRTRNPANDYLPLKLTKSYLVLNNILLDKEFTEDYSLYLVKNRMVDDIDNKILNIIQQDARVSNAEIARQIGLAPSAVLERQRKLEERGIIRGYATELNAAELGFGLTAFVAVRTNSCGGETDKFLSEIPEVLEVHDVAGEDSYWLKVRVKNTEDLARLLRERLKNVPNVISTKTTIVLQTIKETIALPIGDAGAPKEISSAKAKRGKKD